MPARGYYAFQKISIIAVLCVIFAGLASINCGDDGEKSEVEESQDKIKTSSKVNAGENAITLVADVWMPYNGIPGSETPGFMIEIAREAFAGEGYEIKYINIPWARAIRDTRSGIYDGIVGAGPDETPDFIFPDFELGLAVHAFYVIRGSDWRYNGLSSLRNITLGAIRDYSYGTLFIDYIKPHENDPDLVQVIGGDNALENNIRKLESGRIDALIEDRSVFQYHLHLTNTPNIFAEAGYYCDEKVYIAFSPAHNESSIYAGILSRAVRELRESGRLAEILAKYGVEDWKK